jgi:hypothetical protein
MKINRAIGLAEIRAIDIGALQVIPANAATEVEALSGLRLCGDWQAEDQDHQ